MPSASPARAPSDRGGIPNAPLRAGDCFERVQFLIRPEVSSRIAAGGRVVLGPGMRADLILDLEGRPGERFTVIDGFYRGREYRLVDVAYSDEPPVREGPLDALVRLPANPLPEADLASAECHELRFAGGMMGGMAGMREMMRRGLAWSVNGIAASGHDHAPLLTLGRDRSCVLALLNETAFPTRSTSTAMPSASSAATAAPPAIANGRTRC